MFSRLSNVVFAGAVACMLSACGGGQADHSSAPAPQGSAASAAPLTATAPAAASAPAAPAVAAPAAEVQLAYAAPVAVATPAQADMGLAPVQGSGLSMMSPQSLAALAAAEQARMAELAAAQEAARWQAAMGNPDDEAFLALILYHENAERQAALSGVRHRKPSDADCSSPRLMMCAGN